MCRSFFLVSALGLTVFALPALTSAQSGGWGEPIAGPKEEEPVAPPDESEPPPRPVSDPTEPAAPARTEPNPDWADAPPTEYEQRSRNNPDWVEEVEPPVIENTKRRASEFYDIRYANRSLTMPRGMMRGTFDTVVGRRLDDPQGRPTFGPTGTISTMNFGVSITLAEDFEIGFSRYRMGSYPDIGIFPGFGFGGEGLISFSMSPEAKFGDIPFYARFEALDREHAKLGIDAVFRIPSRTEFGFIGGVPMRFIANEQFAFDTGFQFVVDNNPNGPSVWSLNIPFTFVANATDQVFVKLNSGMDFFDLGQTIRTATSGLINGPFYFFPLGATVGGTVEAGTTMMDIFASFRFPTLYGFTTRASEVNTGTWQVTVGINFYSPVLFKGSAL
ncbi:MAG: hypothetical protein ACN4G0_08615 [Polyangiales bacterium]